MYQIIRYPMGIATDMEIDLTKMSITDGCQKQVELQKAGHELLAVIWERKTLAEIKPLLAGLENNPHCAAVTWKKGRRGLIAKRTDGKLFEFDIVKK